MSAARCAVNVRALNKDVQAVSARTSLAARLNLKERPGAMRPAFGVHRFGCALPCFIAFCRNLFEHDAVTAPGARVLFVDRIARFAWWFD